MQNVAVMANEYVSSKKKRGRNLFPTINRYDVMEAILSVNINDIERNKLSNMYSQILSMEKDDLKYIEKVAVSSTSESEIYDILARWKNGKEIPENNR